MSNKQATMTKPLSFPLRIPTINLTVPQPQLPHSFSSKLKNASKPKVRIPPFPSKHQSIDEHNHSQPQSFAPQSFRLTIPPPPPNKRIRGIAIKKSIVYGNITHRLEGSPDYSSIIPTPPNNSTFDNNHNGRRARNTNSYDTSQEWFRWTVYVRGAHNEDLSYFISKVVFVLHETYVNPIRVIESSPFEVTECGWGQFEVKIEIYFHSIPGLHCMSPYSELSVNHPGYHPPSKKQKVSCDEAVFKYNHGDIPHDIKRKGKYEDKNMGKLCHDKQNEIMEMFNNVDGLPNEADTDSVSSSSSFAGYDNKVVFLHSLRLFPKADTDEDYNKKGIVEEKYATIEFFEPYYYLFERLWMGPTKMVKYDHPFYQKYWKKRIIQVAHKEQQLIDKISKCHQQLLMKMKEKKEEYDELIKKSNDKCKK